MKQRITQPWIAKPLTEFIFILLPPFFSLLVILMFPHVFQKTNIISDAGWIILILLVDVAHVYSTLYRTYFDPNALKKQRFLLWTIPVFSFIVGVMVYTLSALWFWRLLAYIAVFHFVRQQYGFMRVYSRKEKKHTIFSAIDTITIYYATIYPLLYWHLSGPKNFNWFIDGDFIYIESNTILQAATWLYYAVIIFFLIKEFVSFQQYKQLNLPKLAIIVGTLVSWYFGIVYFNGDMAFTLLNVVSHGIPYMALMWLYGIKHYTTEKNTTAFLKMVFSRYGFILFLVIIFLFAFAEEGLWDLAVWKEHGNVFKTNSLKISFDERLLSFIIPLLALPQLTHYVLDGFIWKIKQDEFKWNNNRL